MNKGSSATDVVTEEVVLKEPGVLLNNLLYLNTVLPSDTEWRNENYFRLVHLHRYITEETVLPTKYKHLPVPEEVKPDVGLCSLRKDGNDDCTSYGGTWTHRDLVLTSHLLSQSENIKYGVAFQGRDFEQTRRVITLTFNILRFKPLLKEALDVNEFFKVYPKICPWNVWLLLYDLYHRNFLQRVKLNDEDQIEFDAIGLTEIDEILWNNKVSLAATISRLRIKRVARTLEDLLPPHLQLSHQIMNKTIIGGWVNTFKIEIASFITKLTDEMGFMELEEPSGIVPNLYFVKDHIVPKYYHCHPNVCEDVLNSKLTDENLYIHQDRSQCLAAVMFLKVMEQLELCGSVAQTHLATPPSTAYLASLIAHNPNIDQLLIFSTGSRKSEYEEYFKNIGAGNVLIFSEQFSEITPENTLLNNIIAVMASPPTSNTAANDPINLAMARGGDVSVLYALTEEYFNKTVDSNVIKLQRETLLKAMSMPQIQAIIYESHSRSIEENEKMVYAVVNEMNQWAADKYWDEIVQRQNAPPPNELSDTEEATLETIADEAVVQVPLCDLYEVAPLPDVCPTGASCVILEDEGVYLALIKRKEITRLDPKYMISMAEVRGLFGRQSDPTSVKVKEKKNPIKTRSFSWRESTPTKPQVEVERLTTPTLSSMRKDIRLSGEMLACERFNTHIKNAFCDNGHLARLWWKTLLSYVKWNMRRKSKYPSLRLRRPLNSTNKEAFPTHYTSLDLDLAHMNVWNLTMNKK